MAKNDSKNENKVKKHFFKDFKAELKKVIWPTPKQLVNNTIAVVTIVIITTAIVFVLDVVFDFMNKYGISNVQNIVNSQFNKEDTNTTEQNSDEENTNTTDTEGENTDTTTDQNSEDTSSNEAPAEGNETNPE